MNRDLIYRQDAFDAIMSEPPTAHYPSWYADIIKELPSAPLYTDDEIQTMQDLEWAQMRKMYELGKAEAMQRTQMSLTEPCEHCQEFDCYGWKIPSNHKREGDAK